MKHTQTQGQETGLASLLDGTTPGPWMVDPETPMNSLNEYRHEIRNVSEGWLVGYGWACSEQMAIANARLIAAAPALAASHAEMLSVLDDIASRMAKHGSGDVMLHSRIMAAVKDAKKVAGGAA